MPDAITASDQVRSSYYDIPPIKAPHWRWYIINYFFLGGISGAAFAISALGDLVSEDGEIARAGRYLSIAALLPCPVLLILDLGRPERFLNMLRVVKLRSPMSLGSWALLFLSVFSGMAAFCQLLADLTHRTFLVGPRRVCGVLGLPFALFMSGYTGVLLAATNVPLWARNSLLWGPTFVSSSFSSTLAALSLILGRDRKRHPDTMNRMAQAEVICLSTELALMGAGIVRLGELGKPLTHGRWGKLFWPITVVGGLILPLGLHLGQSNREDDPYYRSRIAALLVLIGSYTLRVLMIFAGRESASRPADYFALTSKPVSPLTR
jgi:formate-dependent nitrite reductase membrane component NrfD